MVMRDPNVLLLGIARTPEREQRVSFIGPLFESHVSAFVLKDRMAELNLPAPALRRLRAGARRGIMLWLPDCPSLMETRLYPAAGGRQ